MAPAKQLGLEQSASPQEHYKHTLERLSRIQSHLATTPRTGKLKGKVAIITGVGSLKGIGRASALSFAHEGAQHLYLMDLSGENLPNLKSTIEERYPDVTVTVIQADAADDKAISDVCHQALREQGRLDIFFANVRARYSTLSFHVTASAQAGVAFSRTLEEISGEMFTNMMRINALSCFLAVKHASAAMKQTNEARGKPLSGGSIILTASSLSLLFYSSGIPSILTLTVAVAGIRSGAGPVDYSASKAAVNSIAQTTAWQLQRTNVRVNALCPGIIETAMTAPVFDRARQRGTVYKIGQINPLGRYGVPEEIANAALFLASDDSSYVNGQLFAVDGGLTASGPVVSGKFA
ncbi:sex determination protein tasselseed-2 [Russula ochroleuca]|uniref:Sex determination protein tasselseed-2 n=1 Tax=Russula ochroleuca TaxID=152965 RepID=A0A9P5MZW9_9AGAM|nr:sex determination protein tasselseed-2 [Russula ochroleuca]